MPSSPQPVSAVPAPPAAPAPAPTPATPAPVVAPVGPRRKLCAFVRIWQEDPFTPYLPELDPEGRIDLRVVRAERPAEPEDVLDAEAVIMAWQGIDTARLAEMPCLRLACRQSIGLDGIDVDALTAARVGLCNTPAWCSYDVALHSVALMLDLYKKVTYLDRHYRAGETDGKRPYMPSRPCGQTFGMVFFGNIARETLPIVRALGMHVLVYAPTKSTEYLREQGCEKVGSVDELCARSDVVSLCCPLIPETRHIIGERQLALMKPTAFLINVARGGLVDDAALAKALREGRIRGAGLDCLEGEYDPGFDARANELLELENVVATPHAAWLTREALAEQPRAALRQTVAFLLEGTVPAGLANPEAFGLAPRTYPAAR